MTPRPFAVVHRRREAAGIWTLELEPVDGEPLRPLPGQFTMVYAFGIGEVALSVSGVRDGRLIHTVAAVGAVTTAICASRPGTVLGVRGPLGNSWPLERAQGSDVVVVAGGVGLAPLRGRAALPARPPRRVRRARAALRQPVAGRRALPRRARALAAARDVGRRDRRRGRPRVAGPGGVRHRADRPGAVRPRRDGRDGVRAGDHDDPLRPRRCSTAAWRPRTCTSRSSAACAAAPATAATASSARRSSAATGRCTATTGSRPPCM